MTGKLKDKIKECWTALSVISSCLTWSLQPLHISINKVSKESLRNKYVRYWIWKNTKVSKSVIEERIDESWYSGSVIANEMIFSSFKYSGISNSLDGSEDG